MNVRWSAARLLTVGLLGLCLVATSRTADAADLDDGRPDTYSRYGSPYDDPRYRDLYGPDHQRSHPPPYRDDRYAASPPVDYIPRGSTKDGAYLAPLPHPPRFAEAPRHLPRYEPRCVPRRVVRARMEAEGWHDFHDAQLRGGIAHVKARRPNGRLFALDVDRCTGDIVRAHRLERNYAQDWRAPRDWRDRYDDAPPRNWRRAY